MRNRNSLIWIAFACCACLVAGAMLWLTRSVIRTERDRALAEIRAELQERVRLSLWKMDSLGAGILLEENSIPPQLFLDGAKTSLPVIVRFETPDGAACRGWGNETALQEVESRLPELIRDFRTTQKTKDQTEERDATTDLAPQVQQKIRGDWQAQNLANDAEKANRERFVDETITKESLSTTRNSYQTDPMEMEPKQASPAATPSTVEIPNPAGEFKAAWSDGALYLIRRGMTVRSFAQGSLVDVPGLQKLLLAEALQLLPGAELSPATNGVGDSFVLASFPFRLSPGDLGTSPLSSIPRTISVSLLAGWLAALVALLTAFFLILNVMKLSERRASFVSAVTHELRTPLTTFRLYSDMLSTGAVREEKRATYLNVLSREADRLSHLVENVLAFSQIERGSARSAITETDLNQLLGSFLERFSTRLSSAGLSLEFVPAQPVTMKLDASALEHILFNLIDNAAKYASSSQPPVVSLETVVRNDEVEIRVADNGPGIKDSECRRIFRPFHKSAKQAAETKPGVGLGLSLSRRLARSMGGSLSCRKRPDGTPGAVFILKLPK